MESFILLDSISISKIQIKFHKTLTYYLPTNRNQKQYNIVSLKIFQLEDIYLVANKLSSQ